MGEPTTNSMIVQSLKDLREDMNRQFSEFRDEFKAVRGEIAAVKVETSATNGRVRKLELYRARIEGAQTAYRWVLPVISSLLSGGGVSVLILLVTGHL